MGVVGGAGGGVVGGGCWVVVGGGSNIFFSFLYLFSNIVKSSCIFGQGDLSKNK
jgi:hypothetical protein